MPPIVYGTAWKEDRTAPLVKMALAAGARAIDTANQRRHYHEAAVGEGIAASGVARDALFLQTKFTFRDGQDHRLPYDPAAPIARQVEQSFASSLEHLRTDRLDSYVLHGPTRRHGLGPDDWEAWRAMETIARAGRAAILGVSNVGLDQLEELHAKAAVKPAVVQNRCYASRGWDRDVRRFCRANGLAYQGFSLLTANREVLAHPRVKEIAARSNKTPAQVVFRFALQAGMVVLTGTTSAAHLADDLAIAGESAFPLSAAELEELESLAG